MGSNFQIRVRVNGSEGWMEAEDFFHFFNSGRYLYDRIPEFQEDPGQGVILGPEPDERITR